MSVLYALGDARVVAAVEAAHTDAVLQSVASMSPRIAYTRTGHAGVAVVDGEFVWGFDTGTARAEHWIRNSTITC